MPDKPIPSGPPLTRKKYTPAFKAECVRQVAAGARQTDVARTQGLSPALLGRWQRQALVEAVPSSVERDEIKRLCAELMTEAVGTLCRVLQVSPVGCYQWLSRANRPAPSWEPAASAAFSRHAQRYGTRRLRAELCAEGNAVGRYALRTWLRHRGLRTLSTRPQRPRTTGADPADVVAENQQSAISESASCARSF